MTKVRLGRDAKLYINTASFGSPTWSAVDNISDLAIEAAWNEAAAPTRESKVEMAAKTQLPLAVTGKMKFDLTDANTGTILDALVSDAVLDIMVLNTPSTVNGGRGYRFECQVFDGSEDQGLGTAIYDAIKFKPYPNSNSPASVKVASGAPVFTAF